MAENRGLLKSFQQWSHDRLTLVAIVPRGRLTGAATQTLEPSILAFGDFTMGPTIPLPGYASIPILAFQSRRKAARFQFVEDAGVDIVSRADAATPDKLR
jgi:hypothetical protein